MHNYTLSSYIVIIRVSQQSHSHIQRSVVKAAVRGRVGIPSGCEARRKSSEQESFAASVVDREDGVIVGEARAVHRREEGMKYCRRCRNPSLLCI